MSLPKIVKTVFYVDPSKNRNYSFDVNFDTSMLELKNILAAASNVNKIGLRIYHKQTEKEYTGYNDETLEELFPSLNVIEFIIKIDKLCNTNKHNNLKLGNTCSIHPNKYCIFYCFELEKSLCSLCVSSGKYSEYTITEKFDYLKPSEEIVGGVFTDLDEVIDKVSKGKTGKDIDEFRLKLKTDYFPSLIELLRKIEMKMNAQIDKFNDHCEVSIKTIKLNKDKLKSHLVEGLNELKYQLDIENMLKDEGVFLHFDYKVRDIANEKEKVYADTEKLNNIIASFVNIRKRLEEIYLEIKVFLEGYLDEKVYDQFNKLYVESKVSEINRESVLNRMLSDFKKQGGRIISEAKNKNFKNSNFITRALGNTIFNLNSTYENLNTNNTTFISKFEGGNSNSLKDEILPESNKVEDSFVKSSNVKNSNVKDKDSHDKSFISESNILMEYGTNNIEDLNWLINVNEGTSSVTIFVIGDSSDKKIKDRNIKISPTIHGTTSFFPNCASVNTCKGLYISGGEIKSGEACNLFFYYNPALNVLQRKEDMPIAKHSHSLFYLNDFVYCIGGYNSNTSERYDAKTSKWQKLSNMNFERSKPILYHYNGFLYAFFGYYKGEYVKTIERLNIKSVKSKWEIVAFNNPDILQLARIGSACIPDEDDKAILLLGGKNGSSAVKDIVKFSFVTNTFTLSEVALEELALFKESVFLKLDTMNDYFLYNLEASQLLRLCLN